MPRLLDDSEINRQLADLTGWSRTESGGDTAITASYTVTDFQASLDLVNRVGQAAELMNHHPDIDIRWDTVTLVLSTHSEGGLTQLDIEAAHRFNEEVGMVGGTSE